MQQLIGTSVARHSFLTRTSRRLCAIVILFVVWCVPTVILACMWDYDTLQQERSRFPSTLELITGQFLRHSPEFYQWRIKDRLARLKADPTNLALHDDLAVAYQKTSQAAKAIEVMEAKDKIKPGLYETYSNLGTFHILAGDFELGLPFIDKALAINPEAHFGREKYQKWLVEYALLRQQGGKIKFPLKAKASKDNSDVPLDFGEFLEQKYKKQSLSLGETQHAVKGVLGMMRFANHDNPLLLEALGDLMLMNFDQRDGKQLAARCFLKASYVVTDEEARKTYREYAERALSMQVRDSIGQGELKLSELEAQFKRELNQADQWYGKLRDKEKSWIQQGKNVDAEFDLLYSKEPKTGGPITLGSNATMGAGVVAALLGGFMIWRRKRSRSQVEIGTPAS